MTSAKTSDERPKEKVARRVVSQNRQYFVPKHGVSVEAAHVDGAVKKAKVAVEAGKDGDG